MGRSFEITGASILYVLYASSLAVLAVAVGVATWPPESAASVALAVLVALLLGVAVVGAWRRRTGRAPEHFGTDEDVAYDPVAYPGQAAIERWEKSIDRLSGGDGDGE